MFLEWHNVFIFETIGKIAFGKSGNLNKAIFTIVACNLIGDMDAFDEYLCCE